MDLDEVDVFGFLRDVVVPSALTYCQYAAAVVAVGQSLRLGDPATSRHTFNLLDEDDLDAGDAHCPSAATPNLPVCAHLAREGAVTFARSPALLPTVVCRTAAEEEEAATAGGDPACHHGPPHVHCLRCLSEAVEAAAPYRRRNRADLADDPIIVRELRHTWQEHHRRHRAKSERLVELLEGTRVAYVGDSDDEFDLETEEGFDACEAAASAEARHCCFLVSAGTPACPLIVAYCAECRQFCPLTTFTRRCDTTSGAPGALGDSSDDGHNNDSGGVGGGGGGRRGQDRRPLLSPLGDGQATQSNCEEEAMASWVSDEDPHTVAARLLLACQLLWEATGGQAAELDDGGVDERDVATPTAVTAAGEARDDSGDAAGAAASSWVFMYMPSFFDLDAEEALVDEFEDGAECTHGNAVLPAARVVGLPPNPRLRLLDEEDEFRAVIEGGDTLSPRYLFAEAVEGFLIGYGSPSQAAEKTAMVLRHNNRLRATTRLVFVEDTGSWEHAWVLYNLRERGEDNDDDDDDSGAPGGQRPDRPEDCEPYADPGDLTEAIRMKRNYTVTEPVPLDLWCAYTAAAQVRCPRQPLPQGDSNAASGGGPGVVEHDGLPFSLESRTLTFFAGMTAVARALAEAMSLASHPSS